MSLQEEQAIMRTSMFFVTVLIMAAVIVSSIGMLVKVASSAAIPLVIKDQYDGMKLYADKCVSCHDKDGSGGTTRGKAMKVPNLRMSETQKKTDKEMFEAITKPAAHRGLQKQLGDENLRLIVMHLRTLK
jgi:cytochrome c553